MRQQHGLVEALGWDSAHFGVTVGRVARDAYDLRAAAAEADALSFACTYLLVSADDPARLSAAQRAGFVVVDVRIELATEAMNALDPAHGCRAAHSTADAGWLKELAAERFTSSRFFADPRFGHDAAASLFEAWVDSGLEGGPRQLLISGEQTGFVIARYDHPADEGVIELIASSADAARGTGRRLLSAAHERFLAEGLTSASVVTQAGNIAALRLYESAGYRIRHSDVWLHRWRET